MKIRTIKQFVTVADARNIQHASEMLHINQSALSRKIRSLEREIGVDLLTRTHNGVALTEAGKSFYENAKILIDKIQCAQRDVFQIAQKRPTKIGLSVTVD